MLLKLKESKYAIGITARACEPTSDTTPHTSIELFSVRSDKGTIIIEAMTVTIRITISCVHVDNQ